MQSLALSPPYISMGPTCDMIGMQPTVEITYAKIEKVTRIRTAKRPARRFSGNRYCRKQSKFGKN